MSQFNTALASIGNSPGYSLDQILQATRPQAKQPGGFRRILGGIVGSVGNIFAPGVGGLIGRAIGGGGTGGINQTGLLGEAMQFLQFQQQMSMEQEAYEAVSAIVKSRHDAAMAAIRNIN